MTSAAPTRALPDIATNWPIVAIATFGGATGAMQVGKAASVLPLIRAEFGSDVGFLALYLSIISIIAATIGILFGVLGARIGTRRSASLGLVLLAAGSIMGAFAHNPGALLGSRLVEAVGFTLTSTAFPAIVRLGAGTRQQSLALGVWAAWMPLGVAAAMGISVLSLHLIGWRGLFVICALLPLLALVGLWRIVPRPPRVPTRLGLGRDSILRAEVLLMAVMFVTFSGANMIYLGFLPTILVDTMGLGPAMANLAALLAILCLVPTNILGGRWLDRGAPPALLLGIGFSVMLLTPWLMLAPALPDPARFAAMAAFALAAGLPPSVAWAAVARLARSPQDAPILSGLIYQGAAIGQLSGPLLAGLTYDLVQSWWSAVWAITLLCALALIVSLAMARLGTKPYSVKILL